MKLKKMLALGVATALVAVSLAGCTQPKPAVKVVEPEEEIVDLEILIAMKGENNSENNVIKEKIAEKTGVRLTETYTQTDNPGKEIQSVIDSKKLPDLIYGGDSSKLLYESGVLVPWDEYLEKYPNLKEMYTDEEWDSFRQDDGHIYWADVFSNTYGEDKSKLHNDEAFWIQARVLEYFDYPQINTLDDYFDILEKYYEENKTFTNAQGEEIDIIPYTSLCDDWRYFCIENAPNFLDGYRNVGTSISVNTTDYDAPTVITYDNTPTAKRYLGKLNEEYNKGIVDKDFDTQVFDEYIAKLSTGAVLGMCDQYWDFYYMTKQTFDSQGLTDLGCEYVPLGLTIDEDMSQCWHEYGDNVNNSLGIAVTMNCLDADLAFSFLNDMLDQDIHNLRFWGIEGEDYLVDENGLFYRTPEMRAMWEDDNYKKSHICTYSYLPQWLGTSRDNINAMQPSEQDSEYWASLSEPLANCFKAYGVGGYVEMIGSVKEERPSWADGLSMYSSHMTTDTPGGYSYRDMGECKHEWIPKVVKASDFEATWNKYMAAYDECKPEDYVAEKQDDLDRLLQ